MKRAYGNVRILRREAAQADRLPQIIACEVQLEEALHYLIHALATKPKRGKKPVAIHSMRVATLLGEMGYPASVVVAGLLHDILEKTAVAPAQVARRFGPEVGAMVQATTNDPGIEDALDRYFDSVLRCAAFGEGALLVRASDLIDNADRLMALGSFGRLGRVGAKLRMMIQVCRESLVDQRMIEELARRYRRIGRKVNGLSTTSKRAVATTKAARLTRLKGS